MRSHHPARNTGFTLLEMAAALGLISVLTLGTIQYTTMESVQATNLQTTVGLDMAANQIFRDINNPTAFAKSVGFPGANGFPANQALSSCWNGNGCSTTPAQQPLVIVDPLVNNSSGTPQYNVLSGTSTAPKWYDQKLQPGSGGPSASCFIQAVSSFTPDCGQGQTTCSQAQAITINFSLKPVQGPGVSSSVTMLHAAGATLTVPVVSTATLNGTPSKLALWMPTNPPAPTTSLLGDSIVTQTGTQLALGASNPDNGKPLATLDLASTSSYPGVGRIMVEGQGYTGVNPPRIGLMDKSVTPNTPVWGVDNYTSNEGPYAAAPIFGGPYMIDAFRIFRQSMLGQPAQTIFNLNSAGGLTVGNLAPGATPYILGAGSMLNVISTSPATAAASTLQMVTYSNFDESIFSFNRASGTQAAPQPAVGDVVGRIVPIGWQTAPPFPQIMGITGPYYSNDSNVNITTDNTANFATNPSIFVQFQAVIPGTAPLTVNSNGTVAINNTNNPNTYAVNINGALTVQSTSGTYTLGQNGSGWLSTSDARLKEHVTPIPHALDKVLSLRGVEFDWNRKSLAPGKHDLGVVAQDVEKVFPALVSVAPTPGQRHARPSGRARRAARLPAAGLLGARFPPDRSRERALWQMHGLPRRARPAARPACGASVPGRRARSPGLRAPAGNGANRSRE